MKRKARLFGSVIYITGALCFPHAQQISISGTVGDADGKGIAGAYSFSSGVTAARVDEPRTLPIRKTPFLMGTTLYFGILENPSRVRLDLYTLLGNHVCSVFDKNMTPGDYRINPPLAKDIPPQLYFLKVRIGENATVLTMLLTDGTVHSEKAIKIPESGMQRHLSKGSAVIDSFPVGAVGYSMLSRCRPPKTKATDRARP
jgi:hypothetical protein